MIATAAVSQGNDWEQATLSSRYWVKYGKANPGGQGAVPVIGSSGIYAWTAEPLVLQPTIVVGRKGSAGQAWLVEVPSFPSDTTFYLEPRRPEVTDMTFTYFALRRYQISASEDVIPSLQRHELEGLVLPFPPLSEQQAIAYVLSRMQAAVEVQEKIVATLRELKAATMAKLFREGLRGESLKGTEIGEIPKSWDVVRLDSLAHLLSGGTPSKSRPDWWKGCIPWASPKDIKRPRLQDTQDHISAEAVQAGSRLVPAKTIFVVIRGMALAKDVPIAMAEVPMTFNQDVKAIQARQAVDPEYLLYAISARKGSLALDIGTSAHGTRRMGTASLEALRVPLPERSEQREIAAILRTIEDQEEVASRSLSSLRSLFSAMLHELMTGRVRVPPRWVARLAARFRAQRPRPAGKPVDEAVVQEIVRRIVEAVAPEKIILFGSAARGEMGPDSDLDLLVVKSCEDRRETARAIRRRLLGIGVAKDIIVATPEDIEEYRDVPGLIFRTALREGRVIYPA